MLNYKKRKADKLRKKALRLLKSGAPERALTILNKLISVDPSEENLFTVAVTLMELNRYEEAESFLSVLYKEWPDNELSTLAYGKCLFMLRKWSKAKKIFDKLLKTDPQNETYKEFSELVGDPTLRNKYLRQDDLYKNALEELDSGDDSKALGFLLEINNNEDKDPYLLANIGRIYLGQKDFKLAEKYFKKSILLDPQNKRVIKLLNYVRIKMRK